jgi:uncharacterized damage-inducible protein DinB
VTSSRSASVSFLTAGILPARPVVHSVSVGLNLCSVRLQVDLVRLKPETTEITVRLKPDTIGITVRLKPDTTGITVRLKPDTTGLEALMIYGVKELADSFRTVRKNTIMVAEDIPADRYGFKATPDVKSVGEMLAHIAVSPTWQITVHTQGLTAIDRAFFQANMGKAATEEQALQTKEQIIAALKERGEQFASFVGGLSPEALAQAVSFPAPIQPSQRTRFEMLLSVKEHEMHHRAQLMLIERMLGIIPHGTRQRQAGAQARS